MQHRREDLDATLVATTEEVMIELDAFLVRLLIVSIREDASPGNRSPQYLDAKLSKEVEIFQIAMVEIYAMAEGIMLGIRKVNKRTLKFLGIHSAVGTRCALLLRPGRIEITQILGVEAFAAFVPSTFCLRACHGSAPEKPFREALGSHEILLHAMLPFLSESSRKPLHRVDFLLACVQIPATLPSS